jgi:hypothetical protein
MWAESAQPLKVPMRRSYSVHALVQTRPTPFIWREHVHAFGEGRLKMGNPPEPPYHTIHHRSTSSMGISAGASVPHYSPPQYHLYGYIRRSLGTTLFTIAVPPLWASGASVPHYSPSQYFLCVLEYKNVITKGDNVSGSPCHHSMARPRVADGRDGLQLEVSCEYIE